MSERKFSTASIIVSMLFALWIVIPSKQVIMREQSPELLAQDSDYANGDVSQINPNTSMSVQLPPPIPSTRLTQVNASGAINRAGSSSLHGTIELAKQQEIVTSNVSYKPLQVTSPKTSIQKIVIEPLKPTITDAPEGRAFFTPISPAENFEDLDSSSLTTDLTAGHERQETAHMSIADVSNARAWLKILEQGKGPTIEISWPDQLESDRLFEVFDRCYGTMLAVIDTKGRLFINEGTSGRPWDINLDRYSAFMRQIGQSYIRKEQVAIEAVYNRHGIIPGGVPVRLFRRSVDARLLGGLGKIIGSDYLQAKHIAAQYQLVDTAIIVSDVKVDGRSLPGRINLKPAIYC